jgi:transcriptional antiterminator RfaH
LRPTAWVWPGSTSTSRVYASAESSAAGGSRCGRRFPGYAFVLIVLQWHAARWCPGVFNLIMDGTGPARVPDAVISEIRSRERDGLVELPKPLGLQRGDRVRITAGAFAEHLALYEGQTAHERVAVLLQFLGGQQRTELPASAIEPMGVVS